MGKNDFFAFTSRTKYINRWALMRNTRYETLSEHSAEVSQLSYAPAVIGNEYLGKNHNCERAALLGLYHDVPEIITGDLPTPVKYYSAETKEAYKAVEKNASKQLLSMLPPELLMNDLSSSSFSSVMLPPQHITISSTVIASGIKCLAILFAGVV